MFFLFGGCPSAGVYEVGLLFLALNCFLFFYKIWQLFVTCSSSVVPLPCHVDGLFTAFIILLPVHVIIIITSTCNNNNFSDPKTWCVPFASL